jgi:hypothetical protein
MAIGIDFCGFFASSPVNIVEHNDLTQIRAILTFIQT